jgi:hypothetical protein
MISIPKPAEFCTNTDRGENSHGRFQGFSDPGLNDRISRSTRSMARSLVRRAGLASISAWREKPRSASADWVFA